MEWTEPALVEYSFRVGAKRSPATARLGFPRLPDEDGIWACPFQIQGLKDDRIRLAYGSDGLQAVVIASAFIRQSLDKLKLVDPDVVPHQIVFPRYVPFCLGIEQHRKFCKILDTEIKKETQLSRRRLARRKKRPGAKP